MSRSHAPQLKNAQFRVADGVWSRDFRVICDCQQHGGSRREWRRYARILRKQSFAMALAVSVGVAFVEVPSGAALLQGGPPAKPTAERQKTDAMPGLPVQMRQLQQTVREALFAPAPKFEPKIISEKVREEFFRTEIPYGALIYREARRNNLPPELVAAVIKAESDFRPRLRSHRNALGLMQILPSTGALMGASDLLDPADNIRTGTRYLRYLHRRFKGDRTKILAAYNAGEGNIARFGGIPPFRETHQYLQRVARNNAEYSRRLAQRLMNAELGIPSPAPATKGASSRSRRGAFSRVATARVMSGAGDLTAPAQLLIAQPEQREPEQTGVDIAIGEIAPDDPPAAAVPVIAIAESYVGANATESEGSAAPAPSAGEPSAGSAGPLE